MTQIKWRTASKNVIIPVRRNNSTFKLFLFSSLCYFPHLWVSPYITGCIFDYILLFFLFSLKHVLALVRRQDQMDKATLKTFEETIR